MGKDKQAKLKRLFEIGATRHCKKCKYCDDYNVHWRINYSTRSEKYAWVLYNLEGKQHWCPKKRADANIIEPKKKAKKLKVKEEELEYTIRRTSAPTLDHIFDLRPLDESDWVQLRKWWYRRNNKATSPSVGYTIATAGIDYQTANTNKNDGRSGEDITYCFFRYQETLYMGVAKRMNNDPWNWEVAKHQAFRNALEKGIIIIGEENI